MKPVFRSSVPRLPFWVLRTLAFHGLPEGYAGDIEEEYAERVRSLGRRKTLAWIWIHALAALPRALKYECAWGTHMILWNLKTALRNIKKNGGYSLLNIVGLTLGIGCCLFIGLYGQFERGFDRFHANFDRMYRLHLAGQATTIPALAHAMKADFPEVENFVQMYNPGDALIKLKDGSSFKTSLIYVTPRLFEVFSFPLTGGNPGAVLEKPYSAVIDEETARIYFGPENPVGKTLNISTRFGVHDYQITGLMRNLPANSHVDAHLFVTLEAMMQNGAYIDAWRGNYMYSYVLLAKNADRRAVEGKIPGLLEKYAGRKIEGYALQPLADIHLKSAGLSFPMKPGGDINSLTILSFIAFLILLIGCLNSANLVTALSLKRFREIGVRKVFGANRSRLTAQFLCESLILTLAAALLSVALVGLLIRPLSGLFGSALSVNGLNIPRSIGLGLGIGFFSLILSGLYPALRLSTLKPAEIFKRVQGDKPGKTFFRNSLVIVQFAVSIFLIIASIGVTSQVNYIRNKTPGFDRDHVLVIPVSQSAGVLNRQDLVKAEMRKIPGVENLTFSSTIPMKLDWRNGVDYEGRADNAPRIQLCFSYVDDDFLDVFGLELVAGRNFSPGIATDAQFERAFIINETAAKRLGWENPVGKRLRCSQDEMGTVIGVVKDFHNLPLSQRIEPVALTMTDRNKRVLSVKVRSENIRETLSAVEKTWNAYSNGWPFEFEFMDGAYDQMYKSEFRMNAQFRVFSALAVFLSCFGLFGLVSFLVERRTKEIGIRKVLGASVSGIFALFTRGFAKQIVFANLIAWPIAYYGLNRWLQNFAYRTEIGFFAFPAAGVLSLVVAFVTIFSKTYRAAAANPVNSIRNE